MIVCNRYHSSPSKIANYIFNKDVEFEWSSGYVIEILIIRVVLGGFDSLQYTHVLGEGIHLNLPPFTQVIMETGHML